MGYHLMRLLLASVLAAGFNASCSESTEQKEKARDKAAAIDPGKKSADGSDSDKGTGKEGGGGSQDGGTTSEYEADSSASQEFQIFCERGQKTSAKDNLADYFALFCDGDQPTTLLTKKLIADAYDGSGDPGDAIQYLLPGNGFENDASARTTRTHVALAIKLPISAKKHFDEKGPLQGDPEEAGRVGLFPKNAKVEMNILETREESEQYHVRGWSNDTKSETSILGALTISTHVVSEDDQWELEPGKVYMFSAYLSESYERIKVANLLTASIQIGDDAYLITQADATMENDGIPSVAEPQIKAIAEELVQNMYDVAND